jgi:hypothetical protein
MMSNSNTNAKVIYVELFSVNVFIVNYIARLFVIYKSILKGKCEALFFFLFLFLKIKKVDSCFDFRY